MKNILLIAVIVVSFLTVPAYAQKNMALFEFSASGILPSEANLIRNTIESVLVNETDLPIVDREKMSTIMSELKMQMSGLTASENAVKVGKILNVHYLMSGDISKIEGQYFLALNVLSVENARTIASQRLSGQSIDELLKQIEEKVPDEFNGLAALERYYPSIHETDEGIEVETALKSGHPRFNVSIINPKAEAGIYFDISKIDISYFTKIKITFDKMLPGDVELSLYDPDDQETEFIELTQSTPKNANIYEVNIADLMLDEELDWTGITLEFPVEMKNMKLTIEELVVVP